MSSVQVTEEMLFVDLDHFLGSQKSNMHIILKNKTKEIACSFYDMLMLFVQY